MKSVECQIVVTTIFTLLFGFVTSSNVDLNSGKFVFDRPKTFVRLTVEIPLNFSNVYGKIEPVGKDWFILFEIDHQIFPSTYPTINEDIQAGDLTKKCRRFDAVREVEIELEVSKNFVRIRAQNSERYEFPEEVKIGQEFLTNFYVQEYLDGYLCSIDTKVDQLETSRFLFPSTSTTTQTPALFAGALTAFDSKAPSRRMLPNSATVTQSSKLWTAKVRYATYKMQHKNRVTIKPEQGHSYIDIQKDRDVYLTVQKSMTREINSVWSNTFIIFLTVEVIVVSFFVAFGLIMFILLQIRPKSAKHVEILF